MVNKTIVLSLTILLTLGAFVSSCASPPSVVPYCWVTDNLLAPSEFIVVIDIPVEQVREGLLAWASDRKAELVWMENNSLPLISVPDGAFENYVNLQKRISGYYETLDLRHELKWKNGELEELARLTKSQVAQGETSINGFSLVFRMNERFVHEWGGAEPRSPGQSQILPAGVSFWEFVWSDNPRMQGISGLLDQGRYQTAQLHATNVYSMLRFEIRESTAKATVVYGTGVPALAPGPLIPAYGVEVGYGFWPEVSAREEAEIVRDALAFISETGR